MKVDDIGKYGDEVTTYEADYFLLSFCMRYQIDKEAFGVDFFIYFSAFYLMTLMYRLLPSREFFTDVDLRRQLKRPNLPTHPLYSPQAANFEPSRTSPSPFQVPTLPDFGPILITNPFQISQVDFRGAPERTPSLLRVSNIIMKSAYISEMILQ